jgi:hypothetical protein
MDVGGEKRHLVNKPGPRKTIALAALGALAILLTGNTSAQAAGVRGRDSGGGHGGAVGHGSDGHHFEGGHFDGGHFEGHHFEGHHFDGHHFEGHDRFFGFAPVLPYSDVPEYDPYYAAPSYSYYCPSYNAYYPSVTTCPEPWTPVPPG